MKINPEIDKILKNSKIDYNEGTLILLAIYYYLNKPLPDYIPEKTYLRLLTTNIVTINNNNTVTWNVPLFEEQVTNFDWVISYRNAFKKLNPDRAGTLSTCLIRMKKFFSENPHVRVDDIKGAVAMYFRSVRDPQYLITSHKFIYEGTGNSRNSPLEGWLEKYYEAVSQEDNRISETRKMQ